MDEIKNTAVETEANDSWDNWDDISMDGVTDEPDDDLAEIAEEVADQPTESATEQVAEETTTETTTDTPEVTEEPAQEVPEQFELTYMGEKKSVTRDEITTYAQKGMDYDRIRSERDAMKSEYAQLKTYKAFLEELAAPGKQTIEELMDATRAKVYASQQKREGNSVSDTEALQHVQRERAKAAEEAVKAEAEADAKSKREADIAQFTKRFGNVQPSEIPQEVWDKVNAGSSLTESYAAYAESKKTSEMAAKDETIKTLEARIAALEQNQKNKERSTGSRQTSGKSVMDDLDRLWYDGT